MADKSTPVYDESKIKTLSSLEHIRLRTGMYIGRIGAGAHPDDGCYVLLKEVVDNAIDEYIMGYGKEVEVKIDGNRVSVRDYGRGIPLGKVVDCVSEINTGAEYNDEVFQFSVGLNGVGTKAVNALSKDFFVRSHRDGEYAEASFKIGRLKKEGSGKTSDPNGTFIELEPDPEIFKGSEYRLEYVEKRRRHYSYLNTGLKLIFTMPGLPEPKVFQSRFGLMDLVMEDLASDGSEPIYSPLHYAGKTLEFCFTHSNSRYGETFYSFVNGQYTSDGGTHLSAFREGLLKAVNEYCNGKFDGDDVRECMVGAVAIRLQDPVFESQTKNKLGNTEIRTEFVNNVREELLHFFQRNKQIAETDRGQGQGHPAIAQGIAGGQEALARAGQGHFAAHPATQGLQASFRSEKGKGPRAPWCLFAKASPRPAPSRAAAMSTTRPCLCSRASRSTCGISSAT